MKRRVVVAAIVIAGCSAQRQATEPAVKKGEPIVLATFTGEADPATGRLDIRTVPTAAGRALGMTAAFQDVDSGVTVANDAAGPVWTCPSDGTGAGCASKPAACPNGSAGRKVEITLNEAQYPSAGPDYLTAVYAELTSMTPATGNEPCNVETNPFYTNVSGLGLWSYGPIGGASPRTATADWGFLWNTGQGFRFAGKVIGLASKSFPTASQPYVNASTGFLGRITPGLPTAVAVNGTEVVYAGATPRTIVIVASDGTTSEGLLDLPGDHFVTSLAFMTDGGRPYLWFTTTYAPAPIVDASWVGVMDWDTKVIDALFGYGAPDFRGLVVSPDVPRRAWLVSGGNGGIFAALGLDWTPGNLDIARYINFSSPPDVPEMLAFAQFQQSGTDFLYVTSSGDTPEDSRVFVFDADGDEATYADVVATYDTSTSCSSAVEIAASPTGVLWVSGRESRTVCRIDPETGTATDVSATPAFPGAPLALTVDTTASARIWVNQIGGRVHVIDPADASVTQAYTLYSEPTDGSLVGAASFGGKLTFIPFRNPGITTLGNIRVTP